MVIHLASSFYESAEKNKSFLIESYYTIVFSIKEDEYMA